MKHVQAGKEGGGEYFSTCKGTEHLIGSLHHVIAQSSEIGRYLSATEEAGIISGWIADGNAIEAKAIALEKALRVSICNSRTHFARSNEDNNSDKTISADIDASQQQPSTIIVRASSRAILDAVATVRNAWQMPRGTLQIYPVMISLATIQGRTIQKVLI